MMLSIQWLVVLGTDSQTQYTWMTLPSHRTIHISLKSLHKPSFFTCAIDIYFETPLTMHIRLNIDSVVIYIHRGRETQ